MIRPWLKRFLKRILQLRTIYKQTKYNNRKKNSIHFDWFLVVLEAWRVFLFKEWVMLFLCLNIYHEDYYPSNKNLVDYDWWSTLLFTNHSNANNFYCCLLLFLAETSYILCRGPDRCTHKEIIKHLEVLNSYRGIWRGNTFRKWKTNNCLPQIKRIYVSAKEKEN